MAPPGIETSREAA